MSLFSKALNRVDIEQGVVFDRQCTTVLPPLGRGQMVYISVTDGQTLWQFLYSLTATSKPKFTGEWIEFARNLKPGNKVYFYSNADETNGAQYRVVVRS